jgi:putative aldouronate transport system substrate-binding protein
MKKLLYQYLNRIAAVILSVLLLTSLLTGCKKSSDDSESTDNTVATVTGTITAPAQTALSELPLPLSAEKKELTIWTIYDNNYLPDPNDLPGVKAMEEATNIHINWVTVSVSSANEKFGLMLSSSELPDIIYGAGLADYPGGSEKGVEDGFLLDCTDLVNQYMPNYRGFIDADPALKKEVITDSGKYIGIYGLNSSDTTIEGEKEFAGLAVRKDILDSLKLDVPSTIAEWHDALTTAKNSGMAKPLLLTQNGYGFTGSFITAFGIYPEFYQTDGTVKYGALEDGYKNWLDTMRQWYAEGLIDPDFMSNPTGIADAQNIMNDTSLAFTTIWTYTSNGAVLNRLTANENCNITAVPNPVMKEGDTPYVIKSSTGASGNPAYITSGCKDPELAAMWLDYQYTHEGMLTNFYGIENESYTVASDGSLSFTDKVMKNSDGLSATEAIKYYARGNGLGLYNWEYLEHFYIGADGLLESKKIWDNQKTNMLSRRITLTEEEGSSYNSLYTAISTMVQEYDAKYIMGQEAVDSFDSFMESLRSNGLDECLGYQQAALDRYNNRGNQ